MLDKALETQRLRSAFTLRVVEMVKHTRIRPLTQNPGMPWGVLIMAAIPLFVFLRNPDMDLLGSTPHPEGSALAADMKVLILGEIPVDVCVVAVNKLPPCPTSSNSASPRAPSLIKRKNPWVSPRA